LCQPPVPFSGGAGALFQPSGQLSQPPGELFSRLVQSCKPSVQVYKPPVRLFSPLGQVYKPLKQLCKPAVQVCKPLKQLCKPAGELFLRLVQLYGRWSSALLPDREGGGPPRYGEQGRFYPPERGNRAAGAFIGREGKGVAKGTKGGHEVFLPPMSAEGKRMRNSECGRLRLRSGMRNEGAHCVWLLPATSHPPPATVSRIRVHQRPIGGSMFR
jgi:hypothetical protein